VFTTPFLFYKTEKSVYLPHKITMTKLLNLLCILIVCSSSNGLKTTELQAHDFDFKNSIELSVEEFFQRRMNNRIKEKMVKKRCEILATDSQYVYFGYPYGIDAERKVDTLFKTSISALNDQFPSYKTIEGYHVRNSIMTHLKPYFDSTVNYTVMSNSSTSIYTLDVNKISVKMDFKSVKDFIIQQKSSFLIELDKNTLDLISIKQF
jgi:hypothetical protein